MPERMSLPLFIPIISGNPLISCNKKFGECNNPILQFYFDEENKSLYLKNMGNCKVNRHR
jgi:hypothetical protein